MLKRILIIDDEADILDIVSDQIELLGYSCEILKAQSVAEAEPLIQGCDAIISDVKMPNSVRLEEILSQSRKPVARLTGHDAFSGDLIIRKPFEVTRFREVMQRLEAMTRSEMEVDSSHV